ncbi:MULTISPECIES: Tc toxin subunit A [Burkholderia]|uniref:Tc toxin subunit A n=1 Tax=Burkholderia TaxID=32008 RepID=UPI0009E86716|nr:MULTISPECIES: Tc toxin subunit A [Burkholderia]
MTPISLLIKHIEDTHGLPDTLTKLGYHSVFDVVRVPRERFVRKHRNILGRRAEKMYDLAIGYAHQVSHKLRRKRLTRAINTALRGPFSKPGPDYASQFLDAETGWKDKAPSGAIEANDGPVAYLTYIYQLALQEEENEGPGLKNKLKGRRPDIGKLIVDDVAINKIIPQIQLVNEVLGSAIQDYKNFDHLGDVNKLLATTRFPNTLPFHYGSQQICIAESTVDISLLETLLLQKPGMLQKFFAAQAKFTDSDASDLIRLQVMNSRLAPEQQNIVVEPAYFESLANDDKGGDATVREQFYADNYGDGMLDVLRFESMEELTSRTNLTVPDIEEMLCSTAGGENSSIIVKSDNYLVSGDMFANISSSRPVSSGMALQSIYGAKFINGGLDKCIYISKDKSGSLRLVELTDDRLDRINRVVRIKKWSSMPFEDIDLMITSAMEAEGDGVLLMNDNTLRMLGVFKHYQNTYGVSAKQFASWLHVVTPFAIAPGTPFLDQIFNKKGKFDTPFSIDNQDFVYTQTSGGDDVRVKKLCTALGLNHRQFLTFADKIAHQQGKADQHTLNCNLFVVSAFYRLASLARVLGASPEDFCALVDLMDRNTDNVWKQLAGRPVVVAPKEGGSLSDDFLTLLQALSLIFQWLQKCQLTGRGIQILTTQSEKPQQGTNDQLNVIQDVWRLLPNALVDGALLRRCGAPLVDDNREPIEWLDLLSREDAKLIDAGLVTDAVVDTISATIDGQVVQLIKFISDAVDRQKLGDAERNQAKISLNAAVVQAWQTQSGVATNLLAKTLGVSQSLSAFVLHWAQLTSYKWLKSTWSLKGDVQTSADIPSGYLNSLGEIARRALLCQQFSLSPAAVRHLLEFPEHFGLPSPYDGNVSIWLLYLLSRYDDLLRQIGASGNGTEDDVFAFFQAVNRDAPISESDATELLASLLGWEQEEVAAACKVLGGTARTVSQLDVVMRLQQAQSQIGLTVTQQQQAFVLGRNSSYDDWQAVGQAMIAGVSHVKGAD